MNRFNADGSVKEAVYIFAMRGNEIIFADATGIQLKNGYYDITTGQYTEGLIKEKKKKGSSRDSVPQSVIDLIPDNDFDSVRMAQEEGDYVKVLTYEYNSANSWMSPYDLVGEYVINTKSKNCVAYCKWKRDEEIKGGFGPLAITELGLMAGIDRIEDGGRLVKLFNVVPSTVTEGPRDFTYKIIGSTIYYMNGDHDVFIVNDLMPAPLPTSKAISSAN